MVFFDSNDFVTQYQMSKKLSDLEEEKEYYLQKIDSVKNDREELLSNAELLEKYAREKYLMKKPNEDLFIIMKKEAKQNWFIDLKICWLVDFIIVKTEKPSFKMAFLFLLN